MLWIIVLVLAAVALSMFIGGGLNLEFIKVLAMFIIGFVAVIALKKLWDLFKG